MLKKLATAIAAGAVGAVAVAGVATAGHDDANIKQHHKAMLKPVPHDSQADHGSNVHGMAHVMRHGDRISVNLRARGLSPDLPHAVHIHGKNDQRAGVLPRCQPTRRNGR
jgi:hypothetical protein